MSDGRTSVCPAKAVAEVRSDSNVADTFGDGGRVWLGSTVSVGVGGRVRVFVLVGSRVFVGRTVRVEVAVRVLVSEGSVSVAIGTRVEIVRGCPSVGVFVAVRVAVGFGVAVSVVSACALAVSSATTCVPCWRISLISVGFSVGIAVPPATLVSTMDSVPVGDVVPPDGLETERMTPKISANASTPTAAMATTSSLPMSLRILLLLQFSFRRRS